MMTDVRAALAAIMIGAASPAGAMPILYEAVGRLTRYTQQYSYNILSLHGAMALVPLDEFPLPTPTAAIDGSIESWDYFYEAFYDEFGSLSSSTFRYEFAVADLTAISRTVHPPGTRAGSNRAVRAGNCEPRLAAQEKSPTESVDRKA